MDYIYSKLSESVKEVEYSGATTTTAVVTVDNTNNVISVDVRELSPDILNVAKPAVNGNYALMQKVSANGVTTYTWVSADQVSQPLLDEIERAKSAEAAIAGGINQEINDRIATDNAINNSISDLTGRVSAVESMSQRVDGVVAQTAKLEAQLETESSERQKQDEELSNGIAGTQSRITNLDKEFQEKHNILNTKINNEITDRENADSELLKNLQNESYARETTDKELSDKINSVDTNFTEALSNESTRVDNMINQLNDNVSSSINQLNQNLVDAINTINGGIEEERQVRESTDTSLLQMLNDEVGRAKEREDELDKAIKDESFRASQAEYSEAIARTQADNVLQQNIDAEATERKSVDQHLWDILPDNIIAGTPMQGMEFPNAVNIVFSKYQKHGIREDPADAELVEVPNQTITLVSATQEVAGILTAGDKTKIDNITTDIETAVSAESTARQEADTQLGSRITAFEDTGVLNSELTGNGKLSINVQSEAGRTFNIEAVDISDAGNNDRFTLTLDNNDSISGKKLDNTSVPLVFMSKWDKVEVGGSGAPLNLNSDDGSVTVNDKYTLLNNVDRDELIGGATEEYNTLGKLENAIKAETERADSLDSRLTQEISDRKQADLDIIDDAADDYNTLGKIGIAIGYIREDLDRVDADVSEAQDEIDDITTQINDINTNTVKTNIQGNQYIQSNLTIEGNLTVNGTTTTTDTETSVIEDNLFVTNGTGAELSKPSGLVIKTGGESTFGLVYDPGVDELKAGVGTISDTGDFSFTDGEGSPVTLRDTSTAITNGNILKWTNVGNKLIDSGISAESIATKDSVGTEVDNKLTNYVKIDTEQNITGQKTFTVAPSVPSINMNGVVLTSNVAGNIAVEEQISSNVNAIIDNASENCNTLGKLETYISSVNTALQAHLTTSSSSFTNINESINNMNTAIEAAQACASDAFNKANTAFDNANTHAANKNNPHGVNIEQLEMHSVALNIGDVSIGNVIAPTTQSGAINIAQYVVNITFYDSESNTTKTLHLLAIDEESAGDFAIGVNDGAL